MQSPCHLGSSTRRARPAARQHGQHSMCIRPCHVLRAVREGSPSEQAPKQAQAKVSELIDADMLQDPEKRFRQYGADFGGKYTLTQPLTWLQEAPRVRVRSKEDRQLEELLELVVLNERLEGELPSWEVRRRLEYIKLRRRNWEAIYHYVTSTDAVATLKLVEEANKMVEEALEAQQKMSVGTLQAQLVSLQEQVDEAAEKLQVTQARVEDNLKRLNRLKAEAAKLERIRQAASAPTTTEDVVAPVAPPAIAPAAKVATLAPVGEQRTGLPVASRPVSRAKRNRGLASSLEMEDALRNFWYPAEFTKNLGPDTLVPFDLFGESWVLFRDEKGAPACVKDTCAHRACPLSLGKVEDGKVVCAYHGWKFNGDGQCTHMPSTAFCRNVGVAALPCGEKDGFIWVWPGYGPPPDELPGFTAPPAGFKVHAEILVDVPVEHGLLVENLLDLAHAPFTHTSTFARGWPIPDAVRFHATRMLGGNWDPYPINMSFQPPCVTISTIGLAQPGKIMRGVTAEQCKNHLHQLHVCMPSKRGHTRLLYRMSMDFMDWMRFVPGIESVWKRVAAQVLGEDLVLVKGQQDRMMRGDDTWANPMPYDKLAVRYRRWRNAIAEGDMEMGHTLAAEASMTAGQLFMEEEESKAWGPQGPPAVGAPVVTVAAVDPEQQ